MEIAIIADEDTVLGFELAGVKDCIVFNESTIKQDMLTFREAKILILTEHVAGKIREKKLDKQYEGVIVEVPDKRGSTGDALKEISRLFEEAIGVKLKEG